MQLAVRRGVGEPSAEIVDAFAADRALVDPDSVRRS
jgi:hypothetical protein